MKPLVLITNRFDGGLKAKLSQMPEADFRYQADLFSDEALLQKTNGLICRSGTTIDKDALNKLPELQFLVTATAGFDHIDLKACVEKGIKVFHTPEAQSLAAAELTIAMMLTTQRKWQQATEQVRSGEWNRSLILGRQLQGQKLGIIGYGRVGSLVAKKAKALGLEVFGYDPYLKENPQEITMLGFEELMRTVDIVSLHVPKTKITRHMIKKETLEWMNTESTLINMSRGDVINEADLCEHLMENLKFTAGLDVYASEPLVKKSPLQSLKNVVLTPHVGASTEEALRQSSELALQKMILLLSGETPQDGELPPKALWWEDEI